MSKFVLDERRTAHGKEGKLTSTDGRAELRSEAAMDMLATAVFHDLRSPLAAIHCGAEMLTRSYLPEQQARHVARSIYNASVRIQQLLQDYVDLCRTGVSQPHPCHVRSLVGHAVERIAAAAETQSVVVVQDIPDDLVVTLNRRRIGSVLANLLANALEALPAGGSIHISTMLTDTTVEIRVLDTGPGVAPEIRDRLFEPFVTARKPNGWGFGLAHARQAVLEHGGEMWLEDPPGWGACIAFSLPFSAAA
jgi:signal transduction histidine kinase